MAGHAIRIKFHVQHALGDDPTVPRARQARILDRVLKKEEHARLIAFVTLVDQHSAPFQEIPVSFQRQVDDRIQQWVPGTHKRRQLVPLGRHQRFLEGDALVPGKDRFPNTNQSISIPNGCGNVGDLVATSLTLLG